MNERDSLLAEQHFLTERIAALPARAELTRRSAEARLLQVTEALRQLPPAVAIRSRVLLTFRGEPVLGSEGILADFGMKAVNAFSDAVAAVAASLSAPLAAMGPIPNRDANQLLITGTAVGSFGFELQELPPSQAVLLEPSAVSRALAHTQSLLMGTTEDDERLAEAASELDQRAIDKVRSFVNVLHDNAATCALQVGERSFRFTELAQVRNSLDRLSRNNLHEETIVVEGQFVGVLPSRRSFDFLVTATGETLTGRFGAGIQRPDLVNQHLYQPLSVPLVRTVAGRGKPRYLLAELPGSLLGGPPALAQPS